MRRKLEYIWMGMPSDVQHCIRMLPGALLLIAATILTFVAAHCVQQIAGIVPALLTLGAGVIAMEVHIK